MDLRKVFVVVSRDRKKEVSPFDILKAMNEGYYAGAAPPNSVTPESN